VMIPCDQSRVEKRPLVPEDERAELLAGLECVDYVMIFSELDPKSFLIELRPNIHIKGGDYTPDRVIERETVESIGAELHLLPGAEGKIYHQSDRNNN